MKSNVVIAKSMPCSDHPKLAAYEHEIFNRKILVLRTLDDRLIGTWEGCMYAKKKSLILLSDFYHGPTLENFMYQKIGKDDIRKRVIAPDDTFQIIILLLQRIKQLRYVYPDDIWLHRDIKPGNIVVTNVKNGELYLYFIDLDETGSEKSKIRYIGSAGFKPPESTQKDEIIVEDGKGKEKEKYDRRSQQSRYDRFSEIWVLGVLVSVLLSDKIYSIFVEQYIEDQKKILGDRFMMADGELSVSKIHEGLSDILVEKGESLKNKFEDKGILDTWHEMSAEDLLQLVPEIIPDNLTGEDAQLLRENHDDLMDWIVFHLETLPELIKLIEALMYPSQKPILECEFLRLVAKLPLDQEWDVKKMGMEASMVNPSHPEMEFQQMLHNAIPPDKREQLSAHIKLVVEAFHHLHQQELNFNKVFDSQKQDFSFEELIHYVKQVQCQYKLRCNDFSMQRQVQEQQKCNDAMYSPDLGSPYKVTTSLSASPPPTSSPGGFGRRC